MPYDKLEDLPERVKDNLPTHAQKIFLEAFNNAWKEYKDPGDCRGSESREETTFKVAWAAVKKEYQKSSSGKWVKK